MFFPPGETLPRGKRSLQPGVKCRHFVWQVQAQGGRSAEKREVRQKNNDDDDDDDDGDDDDDDGDDDDFYQLGICTSGANILGIPKPSILEIIDHQTYVSKSDLLINNLNQN